MAVLAAFSPFRSVELDHHLRSLEVKQFGFAGKRSFGKADLGVMPQEFMNPTSFLVAWTFQKEIKHRTVRDVGEWVAKNIQWTKDTLLSDHYQYPSETLGVRSGDCEDHAFLCSSLHPQQLGVAFGFLTLGAEKPIGHAFNVFMHEGVLWVLDTVGDFPVILPYQAAKYMYEIHWIFTMNHSYMLKTRRFWRKKFALERGTMLKVDVYDSKEDGKMDKEFWKSMTFWGAALWGLVTVLQGWGVYWEWVTPLAQGLSGFLVAFGIRRAFKK